MHPLTTERLLLRMFRGDDLDAYHQLCSDPEVVRYLGDGKVLSPTDAWRHIAIFLGTWQLRGYGMWAVEDKATGEFIGRVGYLHPEGWPGVELGWAIARRFWGRGLATEAARRCMDYGYEVFGLTRIISLIQPGNTRSVAVAERLGESLEGMTEIFGRQAMVYAKEKRRT